MVFFETESSATSFSVPAKQTFSNPGSCGPEIPKYASERSGLYEVSRKCWHYTGITADAIYDFGL